MEETRPRSSQAARASVVLCFGLFSIAAQTLLFREFVTSFEGHDIGIGFFFAAWFLWVAIGAYLAQRCRGLAERGLKWIEIAVLAYVPAFVLEFLLILEIRRIAGIEAYALLPLAKLLVWSLAVCAPVSALTGFLFPLLCRWLEQGTRWPITRVYVLESVGSLIGGLGVTIGLAAGASASSIFLVLTAILAAASLWATGTTDSRWRSVLAGLLAAGSLVGLGLRVDRDVALRVQVTRWTQLLPTKAFGGSFTTAQAEYLYGTYQGQWLVFRDGSMCEALPDREQAGKVAAIGLSQRPDAGRVLVIGSGVGLCQALLRLPHVQAVDWSYPDVQYVQRIGEYVPADLRIQDPRFAAMTRDVRAMLRDRPSHYDLVIVHLPGTISAGFNRYYCLEFLECIRQSLQPGGLIVIAAPGGENILGPELAYLGASILRTLEQVFPHCAVVPGEQTFFLASATGDLSNNPRVLRDRFTAIPGAGDVYPANALLSIYRPDRARQVTDLYTKVDLPKQALINRDAYPSTYLYGLLLASRQAGVSLTGLAVGLVSVGAWLWLVPVGVLVALRMIFLYKYRSRLSDGAYAGASTFGITFLIFSAGWVSIATVIILMSVVQTLFGSLYLYVGIASSLFMAGLTAGALLSQGLVRRLDTRLLLLGTVTVHAGILVWISLQVMTNLASPGSLAAAFVAIGLCCGAYLPIAVGRMTADGLNTGRVASRLEAVDHVGACAGGFVTSLVLIPLAGMQAAGLGLALMVLANVPVELARSATKSLLRCTQALDLRLSRLGYVLFGIAASVVICSNMMVWAAQRPFETAAAVPPAVESWTAGMEVLAQNATLAGGDRITYFEVRQQDRLKGYIFSSDKLSPDVQGFGGPLVLAVYVDPQGTLVDFRMTRSNETPRYIRRLSSWLAGLKGTRVWGTGTLEGVHAVTRATLTTRAVIDILRQCGQRFAQEVLRAQGPPSRSPSRAVDRMGIYVAAVVAAGLAVTWWGGFLTRIVVLAATVIVGGLWLNSQYSTEQVMSLLAGQMPTLGLTGSFLLAVGLPALLLLIGNFYCGYVCPFGALQELVGMVTPERFRPNVSRGALQKARFIKYAVFFLFVVAFFLTRDKTVYGRDLLMSVFEWRSWGQWLREVWQTKALGVLAGLGVLLVGMLLFTRFWCRYLCPAGAFLSLFNHVAILGRFLPAKRFGCCEFGLTGADHLDCIHCDRCRYGPQKTIPRAFAQGIPLSVRVWSRALVAAAVVVAIWMAGSVVYRLPNRLAHDMTSSRQVIHTSGQPRNVDTAKIKALIDQGRLSDKEAMYYEGPAKK